MKNLIILCIVLVISASCKQESWTAFRGSKNNAISNSKNVPLNWSEEENVNWKTEIHDFGWSAPVVLNDQIWVTTATNDGKKMYAVCVDFESGEIIHDILVLEQEKVNWKNSLNSYATPSPVIEKGFVYVEFGTYGTACIASETGKIIWKRSDISTERVPHGPASSPIIYKNLLILHHEANEILRITALDKKTGKTVWQNHRPEECYIGVQSDWRKSHATPMVIKVNGQNQLISIGAQVCQSFDPETGEEIWRVRYGFDSTVSCPLFWDGKVFINTGVNFLAGKKWAEIWAVNPEGNGDITETNVLWKCTEDVPGISTPVVNNGLIFMVSERGMLTCLEAKTGKVIWKEKLKGQFNSSPIWIDMKVYITSLSGVTTVINASKEFEILAENALDGRYIAPPSVASKSIILRSNSHIYNIRN